MRFILVILSMFLILACAPKGKKPTAMIVEHNIVAELSYRERIALPPDVVAELELVELDRSNNIAETIQIVRVDSKPGMPYQVTMTLDSSAVNSKSKYGLIGRLYSKDELMFESASPEVFKFPFNSTEPVKLVLNRHIDRQAPIQPDFMDKIWEVRELYGKKVEKIPNQPLPFITLALVNGENFGGSKIKGRMSGNDGCNGVGGGYEMDGARIGFGQMFSTMRACPDGFEQSRLFSQAMAQATFWRHSKDKFELLIGDRVIAVFEEVKP